MLTVEQATRNIAKHARRATKAHRKAGGVWYKDAHRFCGTLANHHGLPTEHVAGGLAALSPQLSWPNNLLATLQLVKTKQVAETIPVYPVNIAKAYSIVHEGASPLDVLGGHKVRAFYHNIANPRTSRQVTVDTHAARAAYGKTDLTAKELSFVFRPKGNRIIQEAYKTVACRYGILPHKLQAAVWLRVKDDLARKPTQVQQGLYIK